jgi:hypothetical protein
MDIKHAAKWLTGAGIGLVVALGLAACSDSSSEAEGGEAGSGGAVSGTGGSAAGSGGASPATGGNPPETQEARSASSLPMRRREQWPVRFGDARAAQPTGGMNPLGHMNAAPRTHL